MKLRVLATAVLMLCAWGLLAVGSANAAELRLPLTPIGSFVEPKGLAVDQESHDVYAIDGRNETQEVTIAATAGNFRLELEGKLSKELSFDAQSSLVEEALLEAFCGGRSCLVVSGGPGDGSGSSPYRVEFGGTLATTDVEELKCLAGIPPLSGGKGCTVKTTVDGVNGSVSRLHEDGTPSEFTALGSNAIDGLEGPDLTPQKGLHFSLATFVQVALDETSGETAGEIYVTQFNDNKLDVFDESGEHVGELTEYEETPGNEATLKGLGLICGVAVDAAGNVYLADLQNGIHKYDPKGPVVTNADNVANFTSVATPCGLAAGRGPSAGALFAISVSEGNLFKLDATTGAVAYEISKGNTTVSVDPTSGHVLAANGSKVEEWDASGAGSAALVGLIEAGGSVTGVAVDGTTPKGKGGTVYVARAGAKHLDVYSPRLELPAVTTKPANEITTTGATLNGTISADGGPEAECNFQYIPDTLFQAQKKAAKEEGQTEAQATEAGFAGAQSVPCEPAGPFTGSGVEAVSGKVSGLEVQSGYQFRLVGENEEGSIPAAPQELETQGEPLIKGGAATQVTTTSATITSEVNPRGQATGFSVEYVTEQQFKESEFAAASVVKGPEVPAQVTGTGDLSTSTGTGDLAAGFTQVQDLKVETGTFAVGQSISGPGIKAGTRIAKVELTNATPPTGTLTLSKPAEGSGDDVALFAASTVITNLGTTAGRFGPGQTIEGAGIPLGTTIVSANQTELVLSAPVTAPGTGVALGAEGFQPVSLQLSSLTPDTAYRFRGVATNGTGTAVENPDHTFSTSVPLGPELLDGRAYELVSPAVRMGDVYPPEPFKHDGGSCKSCVAGWSADKAPMQVTADGGAVAYEGDPFFGGLASEANSYVSRRGGAGWGTAGLSTPQLEAQVFKAFSADLSKAIMLQTSPALSPEAPEGFADLYLREEGAGITALIRSEPPNRAPGGSGEATEFQLAYAGANAGDGSTAAFSRVIFSANDELTEAVEGIAPAAPEVGASERNLYEWSGGELHLVNVLPGNEEAVKDAVFGSGTLAAVGDETPDYSQAISEDGSRIYWSDRASGQVYLREGGTTTIEIPDPGKFLTASPDGLKVLLNDGVVYDVASETATDLTGGKGGFQGIAGAAKDLSRIYFVDTEVLSGEENGNEEAAEGGAFNLYLWEGGAVSFIGRVATEDNEQGATNQLGVWRAGPGSRLAQVSGDGRYLAFQATAQLSGFENLPRKTKSCIGSGSQGSQQCAEVFEYDALTHTLTCVSCNPQNERPLGGSTLSLINTASDFFPQPQNLPPAGEGRLFFESLDSLVSEDTNGRIQDVYEFEPAGVGSCTRAKGCLSLISGGRGPKDSVFVDASDSGDDVFFASRDQLVGADKNDLMDLYDARVGGGFREEAQAPCAGEACAGPIPPPPVSEVPSSAQTSPEAPAKRPHCRRGFVAKGGKCVRRHKKHPHKQARRRAAKQSRGGAR